jgi:hypothetical protein
VSITHFFQEIKRGLPKPVYLLYAEDQFFLKEASLIAAGTIDEAERDFCFSRSDLSGIDGSPSFAQILDTVNMIPFMANRSIAVIENIQEIPKRDMALLEGYVANPSPFATLILLHRGGLKDRFKPFSAKVRSIPLDIRQKDLPLWVKENAKQKGIELTERAVDYLLGIIGPDSLADQAQTWVHERRGFHTPKGWAHQINNEPGAALKYQRSWLLSTRRENPRYADLIPQAGFSLGNVETSFRAGGTARLAGRIQPSVLRWVVVVIGLVVGMTYLLQR